MSCPGTIQQFPRNFIHWQAPGCIKIYSFKSMRIGHNFFPCIQQVPCIEANISVFIFVTEFFDWIKNDVWGIDSWSHFLAAQRLLVEKQLTDS
jgi:hypothetical protein